jgi:hypothetical protein
MYFVAIFFVESDSIFLLCLSIYLILLKTCHKIQGIDKQSKNILSDSTKKIATKYMGTSKVKTYYLILQKKLPQNTWGQAK